MSLMTLSSASFAYGHTTVLQDIDMDIREGEFLGIIGPNGSGKTTLLKAMSGLLKPQRGRVSLNDRNVAAFHRDELARNIALVPQNAILPDLFTALDIVLMGRMPHLGLLRYEGNGDIQTALESMQATQTSHLTDRRMKELSGGEKQRVVIARALTQEPGIILLDEPTSNLDINFQAEILSFLRGLCRTRNMTLVAALHDLNLAAQYCHRLIMLSNGGIYRQGKPADVIREDAIREVYNTEVTVYPHPVNGQPTILMAPQNHVAEQ